MLDPSGIFKKQRMYKLLSKCPKEDLEAYPLSVLVLMRCMFNWRKDPGNVKIERVSDPGY